jgi:hypothetical protein
VTASQSVRYHFALMGKYQNAHDRKIFLGYTLFVYDISQMLHGTLLMKVKLQGDLDLLDTKHVKLEVFSSTSQKDLVDVYLFLDA